MKLKMIVLALGALCIFGASAFAQSRSDKQRTQNVTISVTNAGYKPASFRLRKNVPARITFIRRSEYDCGEEVVFPAYNIRRALPLNQAVTIRFTPRRSGTFSFICGMDMMRGKMIVQ